MPAARINLIRAVVDCISQHRRNDDNDDSGWPPWLGLPTQGGAFPLVRRSPPPPNLNTIYQIHS
jgi:hypothetical protein